LKKAGLSTVVVNTMLAIVIVFAPFVANAVPKLNAITAYDFRLLKQSGFKTISLPIAFEYFRSDDRAMRKVTGYIDGILKLCSLYGFKLIICYHSGDLNNDNYTAETQRVIEIWQKSPEKYLHYGPAKLFFDIFNEPPRITPDYWKNMANNVIEGIRKIDKSRTLIVGTSNYNSIYELSRTTPLSDRNVIYAFHFYKPFSLPTRERSGWATRWQQSGCCFLMMGRIFRH
jgi:endoglucanase